MSFPRGHTNGSLSHAISAGGGPSKLVTGAAGAAEALADGGAGAMDEAGSDEGTVEAELVGPPSCDG